MLYKEKSEVYNMKTEQLKYIWIKTACTTVQLYV